MLRSTTSPRWPRPGWAAGGIVSTTGDLAVFFGALLGGQLLPPDLQREMWTTIPTGGAGWIPDTRYGMESGSRTYRPARRSGGGAMNGSWTYAMGTRDGEHLVVSNMNGDWNNPVDMFVTLLQAELG